MINLTSNEKLVFYGLVKWPELNDEQVGAKVGVNRVTVSAIRNKLLKAGWFTRHYLPDMSKLGCELLVYRYGEFNPLTPWSKREKYASKEAELFYRISTDINRVSIVGGKNFSEIKNYLETAARRHASHGFFTQYGVEHVYYPHSLCKNFLFFDFAPLINKRFQLGLEEDYEIDAKFRKPETVKLSETDKKVFHSLVKNPEAGHNEIAEQLSLSRQTVNNVHNKLTSKGLIKRVVFPDIEKLGLELIASIHIKFDPRVRLEDRIEGEKQFIKEGSQYVVTSGDMETMMLSAFENYTQFEVMWEHLTQYYTKNNCIKESPIIKFYPTHEIRNHMKLRCAPLVKKILEIKEEEIKT